MTEKNDTDQLSPIGLEKTEIEVKTVMNTSINYKFIKPEIDDLKKIIIHLDSCYHITGEDCVNPITGDIVTDNEYDAFKRRLEQIDPTCDILKTVIASSEEIIGKKVIHNPPMTSISKCNGTQKEKIDILWKWFEDCRKIDEDLRRQKSYEGWINDFFCMSYKHDGIALSLEYKKGILISAGLRAKNGVDGIDVTAKTKNIKGIPQKLPLPLTITVRGEIETYIKTFEKMNKELEDQGEETRTNPRAYTAGCMNRKTAAEMKDKGLSFVAYNILNFDNPPYKTEIERATWAEESLGFKFVKTIPFSETMLEAFESVHRKLDFLVDGVVVSVNELNYQKLLGTHGNRETANPKGKIAFKFKDETKEAVVTSIEWQVGRVGSITPVLNFKGIQLEGTTVQRCTAHNLGIIEKNKIGIGSKIAIIKSGKIIPKIKTVIEAKGEVRYPDACPSCGHPTKRVEGNNGAVSLVCDSTTCPAQQVQNLDHYLKRIGVKGIAEKNIAKLCEAGLVNEPADFYKLTLDKLKAIGFKDRSATLILARVKMINSPEQEKDNSVLLVLLDKIKDKKITVKMETFIAALGIDGGGRELGRIMAEKYDSFDIVRNLSPSEIEAHDGIGQITASAVYQYFKDNADQVDELLQFVKIEVVEKKSGKLDGKTFVLSGSLDMGKGHWKKEIENQGGLVKSSVSKKISFLVAGEGSGSKSEKAEQWGIQILSEKKLKDMLKK